MMTAKGLVKLSEECGELQQIIAKKLAYYTTDVHPDGKGSLKERLEDEIADVIAASLLVGELHGLDALRMGNRVNAKLALFNQWQAQDDNNLDGIDAPKKE